MCVLNSFGKTAVWQVELLAAHLMQTIDLVSMTVSRLYPVSCDDLKLLLLWVFTAKCFTLLLNQNILVYKHTSVCYMEVISIAILCLTSGELSIIHNICRSSLAVAQKLAISAPFLDYWYHLKCCQTQLVSLTSLQHVAVGRFM